MLFPDTDYELWISINSISNVRESVGKCSEDQFRFYRRVTPTSLLPKRWKEISITTVSPSGSAHVVLRDHDQAGIQCCQKATDAVRNDRGESGLK